jgi:hypothetical protein
VIHFYGIPNCGTVKKARDGGLGVTDVSAAFRRQ